jgi:hypothetical protein
VPPSLVNAFKNPKVVPPLAAHTSSLEGELTSQYIAVSGAADAPPSNKTGSVVLNSADLAGNPWYTSWWEPSSEKIEPPELRRFEKYRKLETTDPSVIDALPTWPTLQSVTSPVPYACKSQFEH